MTNENATFLRRHWEVRLVFFVVPLIVLILAIGLELLPHVIAPAAPVEKVYSGSLFVSDAGQSHGGFEYTASWNATLKAAGTSGTLAFTLNIGLGDALSEHSFNITDFRINTTGKEMSFAINGFRVPMLNSTQDEIWNGTFNNYYVASWGGYAPPSEKIGTISPQVFPGLADYWYVELRLR